MIGVFIILGMLFGIRFRFETYWLFCDCMCLLLPKQSWLVDSNQGNFGQNGLCSGTLWKEKLPYAK
jgi:hypothetical protein